MQPTLPGRIHQPGSVCLRRFEQGGVRGEWLSVGSAGRFAGFLLQPPHMLALALGRTFALCPTQLACLDCHVYHLLYFFIHRLHDPARPGFQPAVSFSEIG